MQGGYTALRLEAPSETVSRAASVRHPRDTIQLLTLNGVRTLWLTIYFQNGRNPELTQK